MLLALLIIKILKVNVTLLPYNKYKNYHDVSIVGEKGWSCVRIMALDFRVAKFAMLSSKTNYEKEMFTPSQSKCRAEKNITE